MNEYISVSIVGLSETGTPMLPETFFGSEGANREQSL
jgi:hypothetical protein